VPLEDGEGGDYTMNRSAIVYLMDKDGRFLSRFNIKRSADVCAADLRKYLDIVRFGRPGGQRGS
jgi:protein SCO1